MNFLAKSAKRYSSATGAPILSKFGMQVPGGLAHKASSGIFEILSLKYLKNLFLKFCFRNTQNSCNLPFINPTPSSCFDEFARNAFWRHCWVTFTELLRRFLKF
jgi:hypothetical protein